jgi:8-oxo-dGTP diphosphatase
VNRVHLATGLARRNVGDGACVLLVASSYPNHAEPLWNLPGGRQRPGELLDETAVREVFEETGLRARAGELAYVSESYDGEVHVLNATFLVDVRGPTGVAVRFGSSGDHVVDVAWVPLAEIASRIVVGVVREPLLAYIRNELPRRYAGFHEAGITIEWPKDRG